MNDRPVPSGAALVPPWLANLAAAGWRILVTLALALVLVAIATILSTVTASILIAVVVSATFAPYVVALRRRGWSRTKTAAVVSLGALVLIVGAIALVILALVPYVVDLLAGVKAGIEALRADLAATSLSAEVVVAVQQIAGGIADGISSIVAASVASIAGVVTVLFLSAFLTFFLLQDGDKAWAWVISATSGWRRDALTASGQDALDRVGGSLREMAVLAATDALTDFVYLSILGVPLAGPLAVLAFLGGFIPYVGGFVATSVMLLVTISSKGTADALILLVLIGITNVIEGNVLARQTGRKTIDVPPAVLLIALPAGAALGGILGLFAAMPVVGFVQAMSRSVVTALDIAPDARMTPGAVPVWLDRLGQWSWRSLVVMAVAAVAIGVAVRVPTVVLTIVLAIVFAATLDPAATRLRQRGWGRSRAALTVTAGAAVAVIAVLALTIASMIGPLSEIIATAGVGAGQSDGGRLGLAGVVAAIGSGMLEAVAGFVAGLAGFVVTLFLSAVLTFYLVRDGAALWHRSIAGLSPLRRKPLEEAGQGAAGVLSGYMIGTGAISLFGAVTQFVIMTILGIPLALPLAVLSFFGGFVPYIGSFITTAFAFLVTVAVGDTTDIVVMGVYTVVFNIVQGNFVAPLVYGRAVNLHPAIVLLAIPAGSAVAGIIGMFLVVPFLGVVATTWRTVLHTFDPDAETIPGTTTDLAPPPPNPSPPIVTPGLARDAG